MSCSPRKVVFNVWIVGFFPGVGVPLGKVVLINEYNDNVGDVHCEEQESNEPNFIGRCVRVNCNFIIDVSDGVHEPDCRGGESSPLWAIEPLEPVDKEVLDMFAFAESACPQDGWNKPDHYI